MITLESKEIKAFPYSLETKLFLSTPNSSAVAEGNTVKLITGWLRTTKLGIWASIKVETFWFPSSEWKKNGTLCQMHQCASAVVWSFWLVSSPLTPHVTALPCQHNRYVNRLIHIYYILRTIRVHIEIHPVFCNMYELKAIEENLAS